MFMSPDEQYLNSNLMRGLWEWWDFCMFSSRVMKWYTSQRLITNMTNDHEKWVRCWIHCILIVLWLQWIVSPESIRTPKYNINAATLLDVYILLKGFVLCSGKLYQQYEKCLHRKWRSFSLKLMYASPLAIFHWYDLNHCALVDQLW